MSMPGLSPHFTTDRPVGVFMVFAAALVFGYFALKQLPVTLLPEITYPTVTVRTEFSGAAPAEVENEISRPIEETLGVIGGLNEISSISRAGVSDVKLQFLWGTDMADATQEILERLDLVLLPEAAEEPLLLHYDPALDPIMELSLSGNSAMLEGPAGLRRLRRIAELQVKPALEPIKGVAAVRVRGGLKEEIHVVLDKHRLLRSGLSIKEVIDRLEQENINVAGGTVKEGDAEYMVRTLNEFRNLQGIEETIIEQTEGKTVRVADIGRVTRAHEDRRMVTRVNGAESVQIDVYKEADAHIVEVAKRVQNQVGTPSKPEAGSAPRGLGPDADLAAQLLQQERTRLEVVADRSFFIAESLEEVKRTAILGGCLATVVLFLFLHHLPSTLIVAVSIPVSLIVTFGALHLTGISLNIMSLGGLALGIGMLVDSSVVVLESIYRCREEGDGIKAAAIRGMKEIRGPVIASTLTSVAVFFPMVFVEGVAGQAFGDLGLAVVFSLLTALVVALFLIPMLASREGIRLDGHRLIAGSLAAPTSWAFFRSSWQWMAASSIRYIVSPYIVVRFLLGSLLELLGKIILVLLGVIALALQAATSPLSGQGDRHWTARIGQVIKRGLDELARIYVRILRQALRHPTAIVVVMLLCLWAIWQLGARTETELLPDIHQNEITLEVNLPVGTPIETTQATLQSVERKILANDEKIRSLITTYGYDPTNMKRSDEGEHTARFKVLLEPTPDPAKTEDVVASRLRSHFDDIPGATIRLTKPVLFSTETPIVVEVQGDQLPALKRMADRVVTEMEALPRLVDVESTLKEGAPEIQIRYDRRRLAHYGLNVREVAQTVSDMVKGYEATQFNEQDRRVPISVRLQAESRDQVQDISQLVINDANPHPIRLGTVADLKIREGPSEIRRVDGQRVALVGANLKSGSLGAAVTKLTETLEREIVWPQRMDFRIAGQNQEWQESRSSLLLAFALSLFMVYVVMASQFESFLEPFLIMFTVPLALFGSLVGLTVAQTPISVVVFLGIILLVGIVVNNAIVLVDYIKKLQTRGFSRLEAIEIAGQVRLRPILITTATTVLGLLPMIIGTGSGAELRRPMALTIVCGLLFSTLLTLIVIPTCYDLLARLRRLK